MKLGTTLRDVSFFSNEKPIVVSPRSSNITRLTIKCWSTIAAVLHVEPLISSFCYLFLTNHYKIDWFLGSLVNFVPVLHVELLISPFCYLFLTKHLINWFCGNLGV